MLHGQFDQQNVANSIENERFELKNAANKYHLNGSFQLQNVTNSTKMLQILWKMRGSNSKMLQRQLKWQLPAPKCCK